MVRIWPRLLDLRGPAAYALLARWGIAHAADDAPLSIGNQPDCGWARWGLQIVGRWHADTLVLQASVAFAQTQLWAGLWPVI